MTMAARESKPTTMYEILRDAVNVGHMTLTLDEIAVDSELRRIYGIGLNELIVIHRAPAAPEAGDYRRRLRPWRMRVRYRDGRTFEPAYVSEGHRSEAIRAYEAQGHLIEETWECSPS